MPQLIETAPQTLRVLIVEDEMHLRNLLLEVVPEMGFPASAARSAEEAIKIMRADPHDILILDLQLPLTGGMDLFEQAKRDWPQTQVIILTGFGDLSTAQRAIHLDVVEFLSKPCHLRDVEVALDRARRRFQASGPQPLLESIDDSEPTTLAEAEYRQIVAALRRNQNNKTTAAAELNISRRTLHYRLAEYQRLGYEIG